MERMMRTRDGHAFGEELMLGSVWWFPLIAGRYTVGGELGRGAMGGAMGVVLRAHDNRLNRPVALKMLRPDAADDPWLRNRLAREARIASALCHPGVAAVYDLVEHGDTKFIVYELVEGSTLRKELAGARFTTEEILNVEVHDQPTLVRQPCQASRVNGLIGFRKLQ